MQAPVNNWAKPLSVFGFDDVSSLIPPGPQHTETETTSVPWRPEGSLLPCGAYAVEFLVSVWTLFCSAGLRGLALLPDRTRIGV